MMLYIENRNAATRKLLALINKLGKVSEYKINTQKSLAVLYTNNKISERDVKEAIPFTIATKRTKYLGMNLPEGFPSGTVVKKLPVNAGDAGDKGSFYLRVRNLPWSRKWQPTPVFLPGKFHRQKSLAGYNPSVAEFDTAEWLNTHTPKPT